MNDIDRLTERLDDMEFAIKKINQFLIEILEVLTNKQSEDQNEK